MMICQTAIRAAAATVGVYKRIVSWLGQGSHVDHDRYGQDSRMDTGYLWAVNVNHSLTDPGMSTMAPGSGKYDLWPTFLF